MPTEIFSLVQYPSDFGRASAFGVVVLTVTVVLTLMQRTYLAKRRFDTVTGKGYRPRQIHLRRGGRIAALTLETIYVGGAVVLPTVTLIMVSFSKLWLGRFLWRTATTGNFEYVLTKYDLTRQAIGNSLFLAVVGATLGVALSVLQSYYLTRGNPKRRAFVDALLAAGFSDLSILDLSAAALKAAGLQRVTVSLDGLDDAVFRAMNDVDFPVADVLDGSLISGGRFSSATRIDEELVGVSVASAR